MFHSLVKLAEVGPLRVFEGSFACKKLVDVELALVYVVVLWDGLEIAGFRLVYFK